jgi:hypothetical protein
VRETLTLALLDLKLRLRDPAAWAWALLPPVALALGAVVAGSRGAPLAATWSACVLGALALLLAAASAAQLPDDRESGRAPWLASLAPPPAARRVAAAAGGLALALGGAVACALLVGLVAPALSLARPLREAVAAELVPVVGGSRPGSHELRLAAPLPSTGVLAVRPLRGALVEVEVPAGVRTAPVDLARLGPVRREARVLLGEGSWLGSWLCVGLLLGLGAGWLALVAVAVSRFTSAATAALAVVVLVLLAAMRGVLPDLSGLPALSSAQSAARDVLEGALVLAPDLSVLAPALHPAAGLAVGPEALAGLAALAPHALAALLLVLLPGRGLAAESGA